MIYTRHAGGTSTDAVPDVPKQVARAAPRWEYWAALAFSIKLLLAISTVGTNDAVAYRLFGALLRQHGARWLYANAPAYNHPPFMAYALLALDWLSRATGLEVWFWIRLFCAIADVGSLLLVARITRASRVTMVLIAIAPAAILISGFHCNTDPIMIFFILAAIYLLDIGHPDRSAAMLALAACIKIVPVILLPTIMVFIKRGRVRYCAIAGATWALLSMPILIQVPSLIVHNVFGYRSIRGGWGLTQLGLLADLETKQSRYHYFEIASWTAYLLTLAAILGLPFLFRRLELGLFERCGLIMFSFLCFAPGFGLQYLTWLVPFMVLLPIPALIATEACCGLYLAGMYTYWCHNLPCSFADGSRAFAYHASPFRPVLTVRGVVDLLATGAWLSVGAGLSLLLRTMCRKPLQR